MIFHGEKRTKFYKKVVKTVLTFFVLSLFYTREEFYYLTEGKTTTAYVTDITKKRNKYTHHVGYIIWYRYFNENAGTFVKGFDAVSLDNKKHYQIGNHIKIQYFGEFVFGSRLAHRDYFLWVLTLLFFLWLGYKLIRITVSYKCDANECTSFVEVYHKESLLETLALTLKRCRVEEAWVAQREDLFCTLIHEPCFFIAYRAGDRVCTQEASECFEKNLPLSYRIGLYSFYEKERKVALNIKKSGKKII